ncbi:hypothetical protein EN852_028480 [Mesorhizobium sp. M2E.F.Ca.ET.209.01.1.1]|uniref:hypothetical protein n=1 Tax=Mesorhizobium sp. M2E.F.Ca.ET.209.01.1.1 TaxID=2500526 RepID=UPI000FDB1D52|nr:hypothetical protein [Mesorhizobium sp. M2E.F.Ca.ET.209.01.1.1]TGS09937.1 hypothetical protein EN852_028480 [Mesorhizobium sp. M2E.F.Ca.ET.209.01.1.1]
MARLYIKDNGDPTRPSKDGYSNFALNAILNNGNFKAFVGAQDDDRADLVQQHAGNDSKGLKCVVTHLLIGGGEEPINHDNCLVEIVEDLQKKGSKSKHNISLPKQWTSGVEIPNIAYLDKYVTAIVEIARDEKDPVKARNFLFGLMLLTRCR